MSRKNIKFATLMSSGPEVELKRYQGKLLFNFTTEKSDKLWASCCEHHDVSIHNLWASCWIFLWFFIHVRRGQLTHHLFLTTWFTYDLLQIPLRCPYDKVEKGTMRCLLVAAFILIYCNTRSCSYQWGVLCKTDWRNNQK